MYVTHALLIIHAYTYVHIQVQLHPMEPIKTIVPTGQQCLKASRRIVRGMIE